MSELLPNFSKKIEVDTIIRDTFDKVVVLRFGRASDLTCLQQDHIVCLSTCIFSVHFNFGVSFSKSFFFFLNFTLFQIVVSHWYSFLRPQGMCLSLQLWRWLMLTRRTFMSMSSILTSLWYHLRCFFSMPITWKWIMGMVCSLLLYSFNVHTPSVLSMVGSFNKW